jgi:peptidoglycan lytic transglycosylase G
MAKKKKSFFLKVIIIIVLVAIAFAVGIGHKVYKMVYRPNITLEGKKDTYFYIPTGSALSDVVNLLYESGYVMNRNSFEWVAEKKNYKSHIHPGKYLLKNEMSNNDVINLLRSGSQVPVKITFNSIRTKEGLVGRVTQKLEADSAELYDLLTDTDYIADFGFNNATFISMFIPNTYEFYWNTSAGEFVQRMADEYKAFWNEERKAKAKKIGLSQSQVATLASIVQQETAKKKEMPKVAGVYINRIEKGMLLQADPTVIFAIGDFSIRRVLNVHKEVDSPYNTYKYTGLPPGPICVPEIAALDAVLNYELHNYIYFCAKEDFSGYHNFAKTYNQHLQNARRYQNALNKKRIYR